ncbi:hypothetical protein ABEB36_006554 [Hypothenemus hampei]|uniref:Uncharacterized protein n=1 Tax=Hypothenemus hampei TaxID=57062 RepID=A0ABD1EQX5_HYPHA
MSFSTSTRFRDLSSFTPSPATYNLSKASRFEESYKRLKSSCSKPGIFVHKCTELCDLKICMKSGVHTLSNQKSTCSKRHLLDTTFNVQTRKREKENRPPPASTQQSNTSKFKKNTTQNEPPSFLTRHRKVHCCLDKEEPSREAKYFNRHSSSRKSIKPSKGNLQSATSYNILVPLKDKVPKEMNMDVMKPKEMTVLQKDLELCSDLSNQTTAKNYLNIVPKETNLPRALDEFFEEDCNVLFLVNEEYIDDEYDSYLQGIDNEKGYLMFFKNQELFEMAQYLVQVLLQHDGQKKFGFIVKKKTKKKKNNRKMKRVKSHEQKMFIMNIIDELKCEFKKNIYDVVNGKLNNLLLDITTLLMQTDRDIEKVCEHAKESLIARIV